LVLLLAKYILVHSNMPMWLPRLPTRLFGVRVALSSLLKKILEKLIKKYTKQVVKNAKVFAEELKKLGWRIISGGTDTHLILMDTWMDGKGVSGKEAAVRLEKNNIICNFNTIPTETRSPFDPSGIRLGTPAETTRGKKEKDFVLIARKIDKILRAKMVK